MNRHKVKKSVAKRVRVRVRLSTEAGLSDDDEENDDEESATEATISIL